MPDQPFRVGVLDQDARIRQKQASRDRDAARLRSGEIDRAILQRENDFFAGLPIHEFRIVLVGGRPLAKAR
ncbi:MAG: hypothetical protein ACAH20_00340 [Methylobacteriaceae bacterium]|jgi:hypothetical protein|uniref:Uncharacterized protein n=1 Tax=Methylorubrum extorquens TaxID=408 RepID=A0AAX3WJK8_METEX|nr:hypothetical protein [Methylorubrum extorquens]MCG5248755.1 hypothetical protein [Methylorubrum extorquens]MCP1545845.1 hypothetical protein [Methylorubrum extorquens]MCP1591796.1 hypothetical protein [Methylorubrum extorquens]WHQ71061.1 hypothetical protein KEC54_05560 [Methylorubrum extorquens]GEL44512.1 hypothetical protein MEX01_51030 [Methylorubrum extorquens]